MVSNYPSVRAVVFDAVGTLIYPDPPAAMTYYELGRQHGSQLTQRDVAQSFGRALKRHTYNPLTSEQVERDRWRRIVADIFTDLDDTQSLFSQLWDHFARSTSWAVYEDVSDVFATLNSRGLITAIGSNFDDRLRAIARERRPLEQAQEIFVSSQLGFTKPSIEFFRAIEAKLRLHPNQLMMVGDDVANDIKGASQAGWHSLLLERDVSRNSTKAVPSLRDVLSFLA